MKGVNKVILLGTLGKDPEVKYFASGDAFCNVSLATSESWKDKESGEKKEKTEWHTLVFRKKLAEIAGEYLKKGSKVYVEGSLSTRQWEKEGVKHYSTEVVVKDMQMLDGKPSDGVRAPKTNAAGTVPKVKAPGPTQQDDFDDDVPF